MFRRKPKGRTKSVKPDAKVDLVSTMPRGVRATRDQTSDKLEMPSAQWASAEFVTQSLKYEPERDPGQMFLGTMNGTAIGTIPRSPDRPRGEDRHLLTVAGSRAGKSVSMIVPNLLDYRGSALIADPKAELANLTALRRASDFDQAVFVLDPFGKASKEVEEAGLLASFNPLAMMSNPDTLVEDADLIADALVIQAGNDPHWDESAKRFLQGLILHVATFPRYGGKRNLCTVRDLLSFGAIIDERFIPVEDLDAYSDLWEGKPPPDGIEGLLFEMVCNHGAHNVAKAAAKELDEKPPKERDSILSSARRQTSFLDLPRMRSVLTEGTFARTIPDLDVLKTAAEGASIYLCLPAGYMRICSRWLRLFVDLALKAMERTEHVEQEAPVLFCLDEFPVLGYMPQLEAAAGQLAGFGVRLWPIVQDLTQLKALYNERWETFIGNAAVVQFFGNSDLTTLKYMSELSGKYAASITSRSGITPKERNDGKMGLTSSTQSVDLLAVHEARTLFDRDDTYRRQLLIYQGHPPIVASRIRYFEPETGYNSKIIRNLRKPIKNNYTHYMGLLEIRTEVYIGDPHELLGRFVVNAFGQKESIVMPKLHWDYLDWLVSIGSDMDDYIKNCDRERGDVPLGDALQSWLYYAYESREEDGLPRPSWLPPLKP